MSNFTKGARAIVAISQSVLFLLPLPGLAATMPKSTDLDRTARFERTLGGTARTGISLEERVKAIEVNVFGNARTGRISDRLNAIGKIVGESSPTVAYSGGKPDLKPLTPKMDSTVQNIVTKAPQDEERDAYPAPASRQDAGAPREMANNYQAQQSREDYSPAVNEPADPVKDLLRQAMAQHSGGQVAQAEQTFKKVLQRQPGNGDAHFSLGAIAESRGDLNGASQHYRHALQANPSDDEIRQAVTAVENKLRDKHIAQQKAVEEQRQVAHQEKQRGELKRLSDQAAQSYRDGNYDQAVRQLQSVAQQAPRDPDVQYALAQAWRGKGDYDRARHHIGQAVAIDPGNQMYRSVKNNIDQDAARSQQVANNPADNAPAGEITPIEPERGFAPDRGYSSGSGFMPALGGLAGGLGGMGFGLGAQQWDTPSSSSSGGGGGSRLKRALTGAATGAAIGALTGGRGNVKSSAMRGAVYGGLAGLIFGGW